MESKQDYIDEASHIASRLGKRIKLARQRRKIRQEDMAARTGLSRSTIQAIERGETSTGLGAYVVVLWVLGLAKELELIADPGLDRDGLVLSVDATTKRVYLPRKVDDDF